MTTEKLYKRYAETLLETFHGHMKPSILPIGSMSALDLKEHLTDPMNGDFPDDDDIATAKENKYLVRLSAEGFLDCTDWEPVKDDKHLIEWLIENHEDVESGLTAEDLASEKTEADFYGDVNPLEHGGYLIKKTDGVGSFSYVRMEGSDCEPYCTYIHSGCILDTDLKTTADVYEKIMEYGTDSDNIDYCLLHIKDCDPSAEIFSAREEQLVLGHVAYSLEIADWETINKKLKERLEWLAAQ